jgi:hypothetical protein
VEAGGFTRFGIARFPLFLSYTDELGRINPAAGRFKGADMTGKRQLLHVLVLATICGAIFIGGGVSRHGNAAGVKAGNLEAKGQARAHWAKFFAECKNGSYYTIYHEVLENGPHETLTELRKVVEHVESREISEADRLNGTEWAGKASFHAAAFRDHSYQLGESAQDFENGHWGEWHEDFTKQVELTKKNGKWIIQLPFGFYGLGNETDHFSSIACEEVARIEGGLLH